MSVPVLSSSTVRAAAEALNAVPPFSTIPSPAQRERPDTIAIGAARISGHGVATTSTATARTNSPHSAHAPPASSSVSGRNIAA